MTSINHSYCKENLNKMDNTGFEPESDKRGTVELGVVTYPIEHTSSHNMLNGNGLTPSGCSEQCLRLHKQYEMDHQLHLDKSGKTPPPESPWHYLKTIFLVGTIVILVVWIIVITILSQLDML